MVSRFMAKAQSAMEYLMTYGWAILVIAIVLGVLYYFGVFSGPSLGTACLPAAGYLCSSPLLNSSGYLAFSLSVTGTAITVTGINCTQNSTQPTTYQPVDHITLQTGNTGTIYAKCSNAAGPIGKKYSGYVWINYSTATQTGLYARAAIITATVSSANGIEASAFQPTCTGSGTNNTIVTSFASYNAMYIKTVAYTMYGGGGGGAWGNSNGVSGNFVSGNFVVGYGQQITVYAGGGGGSGGYYGGGGGGSGWYGGGGGGGGYEGAGGGGGSSAILDNGALVNYAAGGAGNTASAGGGGGGTNAGGAAGSAGDHGPGIVGGFQYGGNGADGATGGTAGSGGNGVGGTGGGGGGGYGGGGGGGCGGSCQNPGGSNGGNGVGGGTGGDSGTGGSAGVGGNGGSVTLSWAGSNCPI